MLPITPPTAAAKPDFKGWKLIGARLAWFMAATMALTLYFGSFPSRYQSLTVLATLFSGPLAASNLPLATLPNILTAYDILGALPYFLGSAIIFLAFPPRRDTTFLAILLVVAGTTLTRPIDSLAYLPEVLRPLHYLNFTVSGICVFTFGFVFPDGRIWPRWGRYAIVLWVVLLFSIYTLPNLYDLWVSNIWPSTRITPRWLILFVALSFGLQWLRYQNQPIGLTRQQTKWVLWGTFSALLGLISFVILTVFFSPATNPPTELGLWIYIFGGVGFLYFFTALLPLTLGISIFQLGLWEFDRIINRTFVYGILTFGLGTIYLFSVLILQGFLVYVTGQTSPFSVVFSTLIVAALANPLRGWLQKNIDRRFFQEKLELKDALIEFSNELQLIVELPTLLQTLVNRTAALLETQNVTLYLRGASGELYLAETHSLAKKPPQQLSLSAAQLRTVRQRQVIRLTQHPHFALLVPLPQPTSSHELVHGLAGVLALAPRDNGRSYADDERDLLRVLAEQAGIALYVAQLAEERQQEVHRKEAAEADNLSKTAFLASMSHKLRVPLTTIIGYSELLIEEFEETQRHDYLTDLQQIRTAGRYQLELINNMLDLSQVETGRIEIYIETFNVEKLLTEVVNTLQPVAMRNDNSLTVEVGKDVGEMAADSMKVRQVLFNLTSNALKFTRQGHVQVIVRREIKRNIDEIIFEVRDTGIGMSADQIDQLFQPFSDATHITAAEFGGSGLGLAISKRFTEIMSGSLDVQSTKGQGTVFTLTLPANLNPNVIRSTS